MGLRIDTKVLNRRLGKVASVRASHFKPLVLQSTKRVLDSCVKDTPERSAAIITKSQRRQYRHRVDYIPSYHETTDPMLIVNKKGEHWFLIGGKWHNGAWQLPDKVFSVMNGLESERDRRLRTSLSAFISKRVPARGLYKLSWVQCGRSIGLVITAPNFVRQSRTRRTPPKEPNLGYAQVRGGSRVISVVIYNPFLDTPTKYWPGNGKAILAKSLAAENVRLIRETRKEVERMIKDASRS